MDREWKQFDKICEEMRLTNFQCKNQKNDSFLNKRSFQKLKRQEKYSNFGS